MSINPILLQKTMRDNATDLRDFATDLKSWGKEMKKKEEALKKENKSASSAKNVCKEPKTVKKVKSKDTTKSSTTKIGVTDYAAWDKFDVDAELNRLEEDIKDDSDLTDECNEKMYDEAIIEKEKGNKFVKNQKWEEAITCYTKAINSYSFDPIFYANRALCYLKLNKFEECEKDCNLSIKLDDTYVKAYQRRAAARMKLNKFEHAEIDIKKVLILEPKNKAAQTDLDKISLLLKKDLREVLEQQPVSKFTASRNNTNTHFHSFLPMYQPPKDAVQLPEKNIDDSKPLSLWASNPEIIEVKPIKKPPHLRSQKPLKRIDITEVDGIEVKKNVEVPKTEEPVKQHVYEKTQESSKPIAAVTEERAEKNIQRTNSSYQQSQESPNPVSLFQKQKVNKVIEEVNVPSANPNSDNKLQILKTDNLKVIEKLNPLTTIKDVKNTVNDSKKLIENNEINMNFNYPQNSVQFNMSWKNFKSTEDKYKYLKLIDPQDLPKIFLNSLDSGLFSNILEVMVKYFIQNNDNNIYDILSNFTKVKRFGAITMFMSGEDKSNVWRLLDHIKGNTGKEKEDVDMLITKFEL